MTATHALFLVGVTAFAMLIGRLFRGPASRRSDTGSSSTGLETFSFDAGSSCDGGSDGGGCGGD